MLWPAATVQQFWAVAASMPLRATTSPDRLCGAVQQWTANDGEHQRWHLDPLEADQYRVVAVHSGLVLDVFDEATEDGATVGQWEWTGGDNQRWRLEAVSQDETCEDAASGAADVDVADGLAVDGDGNYRDVTGDGSVTNSDVTEFFANQHAPAWNDRMNLFDSDGDDAVGQSDVVDLFEFVAGR